MNNSILDCWSYILSVPFMVQWFKKFCKEDKSLEGKHSDWPLEVDNDQLRAIVEADPLKTTREVAQELSVDHSTVIQHLKQIGKMNKLSGYFMSWLKIKKNPLFWSVVFSYSTQQWTVSQSDCNMWRKVDFIWWLVMTSSVVGLRRRSRPLPQSQMCTRKLSWSLFGGLLPIWSTTTLQILVKPLHLKSMPSKSMWCTEKRTSAASTGQWNGPSSYPWQRLTAWLHNQCFKSLMIGLWSFASSAVFTWPLASQLPLQSFWQLLARKNASTTSRRQTMISKSLWNPEAWIFTL